MCLFQSLSLLIKPSVFTHGNSATMTLSNPGHLSKAPLLNTTVGFVSTLLTPLNGDEIATCSSGKDTPFANHGRLFPVKAPVTPSLQQ